MKPSALTALLLALALAACDDDEHISNFKQCVVRCVKPRLDDTSSSVKFAFVAGSRRRQRGTLVALCREDSGTIEEFPS